MISLFFVTFLLCWCFIYLPGQDWGFQHLLPLPGEDTEAAQPVVNRRSFGNVLGLVLHGSCSRRKRHLFRHIFTLVILTGRERLANIICRNAVSLLLVLVMVSLCSVWNKTCFCLVTQCGKPLGSSSYWKLLISFCASYQPLFNTLRLGAVRNCY